MSQTVILFAIYKKEDLRISDCRERRSAFPAEVRNSYASITITFFSEVHLYTEPYVEA